MNQFQHIRFDTISDFLNFLPKHELQIVQILRAIILECLPNPIEKLAYNVPYYYLHSRICFIWPASIPWGNVRMNGVQLGFPKGYLMRDEIGYLEKGNRKQVYSKTYFDAREIDTDLVKTYIFEAIAVDIATK